MNPIVGTIFGSLLAVLATACGTPEASVAPATPTPPVVAAATPAAPTHKGTYASAEEVRDAMVKAGVKCKGWKDQNVYEWARDITDEGSCVTKGDEGDLWITLYFDKEDLAYGIKEADHRDAIVHGDYWMINLREDFAGARKLMRNMDTGATKSTASTKDPKYTTPRALKNAAGEVSWVCPKSRELHWDAKWKRIACANADVTVSSDDFRVFDRSSDTKRAVKNWADECDTRSAIVYNADELWTIEVHDDGQARAIANGLGGQVRFMPDTLPAGCRGGGWGGGWDWDNDDDDSHWGRRILRAMR